MIRLARRAEWIWRARRLRKAGFRDAPPPYAAERNRHVFFRRSFELSGAAESARVHVSADGRYRLFVNGEPAGFGPARFSPDWICADPHDLAPRLRPGRNVVAALVHSYGRDTSWYQRPRGPASRVFGCGGFFLQGEVAERSGATLRLDTDSSWLPSRRSRLGPGGGRRQPGLQRDLRRAQGSAGLGRGGLRRFSLAARLRSESCRVPLLRRRRSLSRGLRTRHSPARDEDPAPAGHCRDGGARREYNI